MSTFILKIWSGWFKALTLTFIIPLILSSCASTAARIAVPESLVSKAHIADLSDVRFFINAPAPSEERFKRLVSTIKSRVQAHPRRSKIFNILALSGGGADGAYGAGLLHGWAQSGRRPEFEVVTGVSAGAMIAPFAFLGSDYDEQLQEVFKKLSTVDVSHANVLGGLMGNPALISNDQLTKLIAHFATAELLDKIGQRYLTGRFLLIGTSDLDSQRGVIWDIGLLAISRHPGRLELFRKIILASVSVPGAFPPVKIDVEANGKTYHELHVDGGLTSQVFIYPAAFSVKKFNRLMGTTPRRRVYVIRNSQVAPSYKVTPPQLLDISQRSIKTLIKNQGIGDLYRIYALSKRDGLDFNLTYIPSKLGFKPKTLFDADYMDKLYKLGERTGRHGIHWHKSPYVID